MTLRITLLGTGTSHGVPMIGCDCATCLSTDPRDRRNRPSILVQHRGATGTAFQRDTTEVLVDTSTDLRQQALTYNVRRVDAILYTHSHADHILGLDEVRRFNSVQKSAIPAYGDARTVRDLTQTFSYIFTPPDQKGGGIPKISLSTIAGPFSLGGLSIVPVPVMHGLRPILGYRIGPFAYLTDCNGIPDESWPLLEGVKVLVLDALREKVHPTHFNLAQAIEAATRINAERTYFTHVCHDLPYVATCARLPRGMELAYDGQVLEVEG